MQVGEVMGNHRGVGLEFGEQRSERGGQRSTPPGSVGQTLVRRAWAKAQSKDRPSGVGWPRLERQSHRVSEVGNKIVWGCGRCGYGRLEDLGIHVPFCREPS